MIAVVGIIREDGLVIKNNGAIPFLAPTVEKSRRGFLYLEKEKKWIM